MISVDTISHLLKWKPSERIFGIGGFPESFVNKELILFGFLPYII
jgi:hypothetical protein